MQIMNRRARGAGSVEQGPYVCPPADGIQLQLTVINMQPGSSQPTSDAVGIKPSDDAVHHNHPCVSLQGTRATSAKPYKLRGLTSDRTALGRRIAAVQTMTLFNA